MDLCGFIEQMPQSTTIARSSVLYVRTLPRGVEVVIGGEPVSVTTSNGLWVSVAVGLTFQLRKSGYATEEQQYVAVAGGTKRFPVTMKREH